MDRLIISAHKSKLLVTPDGNLGDFANYIQTWKAAKCRYDAPNRCTILEVDNLPHATAVFDRAGYRLIPGHGFVQALEDRIQDLRHARAYSETLIATRGLYPYQAEGVEFLAGRKKALLMDDMGLGKTVQALCAAPENEPLVIVCPVGVTAVWEQHIKDWRPDLVETAKVYSPEKMKTMRVLPKVNLILDEAHMYKNFKAFRTQMVRGWARQAKRVWLLTGTPLMSDPKDLWGVLQVCGLGMKAYGSWDRFVKMFQGEKQHFGGHTWGSEPTEEAAAMLQTVAMRRTKEQVFSQLPAKTYTTIPVRLIGAMTMEIDKSLYKIGIRRDLLTGKGAELSAKDITLMSHTRKLLAAAKRSAALTYVKAHADLDDPMVVFSAHTDVIGAIGMLEGWDIITGATPKHIRSEIVKQFQAGELKGIACTIRAAGTGITLTRSNHTLFVDRAWSPAENDQAEDRTCRIGQDRGCRYVDLVANHPLDRLSHEVNARKRRYIDGSVEKVLPQNKLLAELEHIIAQVHSA
jgi:SNF2 family DNA or RNA helicase